MSMGHAKKFLVSPFPILFLTSCYFIPTNLCFLIPTSYPLFPPFPLPTDIPPNDPHIYDSVPVLLVCLVCYLDSIIHSCEFIAILMFFKSSFSYITPFSISYNNDLVLMKSFSFAWSGKHFICPSVLNNSFVEQSNLGCRSLLFITLNISANPF